MGATGHFLFLVLCYFSLTMQSTELYSLSRKTWPLQRESPVHPDSKMAFSLDSTITRQ